MAPDPEHPFAKAVRAARAYKGLSRSGLAKAIGLSAGGGQIGNYERGDFSAPPKEPMRKAIAHATGVPNWFVEQGFAQVESEADTLRAEISELRAELVVRAADALALQRELEELRRRGRPDG